MVIVQIVRSPSGGIRKHVMDVTKHFAQKGHQLILIADTNTGDKAFKAQVSEDWFQQVKIISMPIPRSPGLRDIFILIKIYFHVRRLKPDIWHGHGAKGGIYARILGQKKSIYSPHGGSLHANYGSVKNFIFQWIEKLMLPFTGAVVVESRYTFNQFRKVVSRNFQQVIINFNGIPFPEVLANGGALRYRIAALGLLRQLKGFDLLVRAVSELRTEYPELQVRISGTGEEYDQLSKLIENLNLENVVDLTGQMDDANEVYQWADVIVVPSRYESFGLVALEAMAHGRPVIVSTAGGLNELVRHGENGRIFTVNDDQQLATQIRNCFQNWGSSKEMAKAAFIEAKSKYSIQTMYKGLDNIYRQVSGK